MAASVWIMLVSVSELPPEESDAVTDRPSAETIPEVTVGVPAASPSALPMATTAVPTSTPEDLAKVTGWSPEVFTMRNSATSLLGSLPMSAAGRAVVEPDWVTVITPPLAALAMT